MTPLPLKRLLDHPDAQDLSRLAMALRDFLPALKRFARQEAVPMSTIAKKAMQFYVQNRDATIDPTALHLLPSKNPQHHLRRDNKIMVLHRQGLKSSQIAGDVGISPARVRQIIRANTPKPESFKVKSLPPAEFDVHEWDAHLPPARRRKA